MAGQSNGLQVTAAVLAQRYAQDISARLSEIALTLQRMLELQQAPRKNWTAAGTIDGAGTVGITAASCTGQVLGEPVGVIIAANPKRAGLHVENPPGSPGNLTVALGSTNPIAGRGIVLAPGGTWDGRISNSVWPGRVSVVGSTAGVLFSWMEVPGFA